MKHLLAASTLALIGLTGAAKAADRMVVVELFTSQGCSSCPPADKVFANLVKQDDVIGLGLHVDYWDYLGWKDKFAQPAFTKRQEIYNSVLPSRYRLVTPQMVVHGIGQVAGGTGKSPSRIKELIDKARALPETAELNISRQGDTVQITVSDTGKSVGPANIQLVRYSASKTVSIKSGENHGRKITYSNVVSAFETIGNWNGKGKASMTYTVKGNEPLAILVQATNQGPILAARKLP